MQGYVTAGKVSSCEKNADREQPSCYVASYMSQVSKTLSKKTEQTKKQVRNTKKVRNVRKQCPALSTLVQWSFVQ
jgi:hypothetical protein